MRFDLSISEFVKEMYDGKELEVYDEHTWRPYCHVRDFARLLDLVINSEKKRLILKYLMQVEISIIQQKKCL